MKIILTHEYFRKFRQHNGRVVKTGTVPSTAPRSTLKPRGFLQWGSCIQFARRRHVLISIPQSYSNLFQPQEGIFQPQRYFSTTISTTNNYFQPFVIPYNITSITSNKYCPWSVDEGSIYIYIYKNYNSLAFHHNSKHICFIQRLYNLYIANITYTTHVHEVYNAYIIYTSLI